MTKTFLPNCFSVDADRYLFGRSDRSRHVLLVLQLLESIFLYDSFRRKHFIFQTGFFFFFFLEQHFLFSEFHRWCPFLGRGQWWRLHTKDGRGPGGLLGAEKGDLQGLPRPPPGHSLN